MDVKWFELIDGEHRIVIWNTMTLQIFRNDVLIASFSNEITGHLLSFGAMIFGDMIQKIKDQATRGFSIEDLLK